MCRICVLPNINYFDSIPNIVCSCPVAESDRKLRVAASAVHSSTHLSQSPDDEDEDEELVQAAVEQQARSRRHHQQQQQVMREEEDEALSPQSREELRLRVNCRERQRMHDLNAAMDSLREVKRK